MSEATFARVSGKEAVLLTGSVSPYEVQQMPSGKAGIYNNPVAAGSGDTAEFTTVGQWSLTKTSGFVALKGNRAYWDHSANAVHYKKTNDRDFYLGRFAQDATSNAASCVVDLNEDPPYDLDIARDPFTTAIVGTQALGGLGLYRRGGAHNLVLDAQNQAQKVDMLSDDGFATGANAIVEYGITVVSDGAGTVVDASIGIANATHATDADSITDSIFCHLDANNTNINFESDDGTTEVAATDSTLDYTEGSRFEVWLDMRDPADVQIYVNGVLALAATAFNVNASAATWKLLAHLEKTASTDAYELKIDWARAHYAEQ